MAENQQPGLGRAGGNRDRAGAVTAGFKVDTKSLDNLNQQWERLVRNVRTFNTELKKIDGKALDRMSVGMAGIPGMGRGAGGSMLNAGGFSVLPGMGRTASGLILPNGAIPPVQGAGEGGGAQTPQGNGGNGRFSLSSGQKTAGAIGLGVVGAAAGVVSSQRQEWTEGERFAQLTAWGTNTRGNINPYIGQARHAFSNMTGYANTQDLFSGLQTIKANQGLSLGTARSEQLMASSGRAGNLLGSLEQGAQATTGFYSPQAYYGLMPLGIKTMSGGKQQSQEQITEQLLKKVFRGRMPTAQELEEGRAQGSNLRATLNSVGLGSAEQEFVYSYGQALTKYGGDSAKAKADLGKTGRGGDQLGDTLYDSDRRKAQDAARASETLADDALPQLRKQVDVTAGAFRRLNSILGLPGVGDLAAGTGIVGGAGVAGAGAVMGLGGGLAGQYLMTRLAMRGMGGGGPRPTPGPRPGPGAGRLGGAARVGGAGVLALGGLAAGQAIAGSSDSPWAKVGGRAAQGAAFGGSIGLLGGPAAPVTAFGGALIGGLAGGVMGAFEGFGGPAGTGSVEEIDAVMAGLNRSVGGGSNTTTTWGSNQDTTGASTGGAMDGAPAGVGSSVGTARGSKALNWIESQSDNPSKSWFQRCLEMVRTSLGVPGGVRTAALSYAATKKRHDGTPPPGVPVWWSGGQYGHVALSAGGGMAWSNDILRKGKIDKHPIDLIARKWGFTYKGWSEDVNGVDVYNPATNSAKTAGGKLNVSGNAATVASFLRGKGMTSAQIAGVLGNLQQESGMVPNTQQRGGPAYGLVQWEGSRLTALKNYAARTKSPLSAMNTQLNFLWSELTGPESGNYKRFLAQSGTPAAAAMAWSKYIERPGTPHMENRIKYANQFAVKGYEKGSWEIPNDQLAYIHKSEMVVPAASAKKVRDYVRRGKSPEDAIAAVTSGRGRVNVTLHMPIQMASGATMADAQRLVGAVARGLESDARIAAVVSGD